MGPFKRADTKGRSLPEAGIGTQGAIVNLGGGQPTRPILKLFTAAPFKTEGPYFLVGTEAVEGAVDFRPHPLPHPLRSFSEKILPSPLERVAQVMMSGSEQEPLQCKRSMWCL